MKLPLGVRLSQLRIRATELTLLKDPELTECRTHGLGNVARGEMRVVPLRHPRIGMAKLRGDNAHWYALHREAACIGVPENMERDCRADLGGGTRLSHRPKLMRP